MDCIGALARCPSRAHGSCRPLRSAGSGSGCTGATRAGLVIRRHGPRYDSRLHSSGGGKRCCGMPACPTGVAVRRHAASLAPPLDTGRGGRRHRSRRHALACSCGRRGRLELLHSSRRRRRTARLSLCQRHTDGTAVVQMGTPLKRAVAAAAVQRRCAVAAPGTAARVDVVRLAALLGADPEAARCRHRHRRRHRRRHRHRRRCSRHSHGVGHCGVPRCRCHWP